MAAKVDKTTRKLVLGLEKGTQTVSPLTSAATDEQIYNTGSAVGQLIGVAVKTVSLVETEYLIEE